MRYLLGRELDYSAIVAFVWIGAGIPLLTLGLSTAFGESLRSRYKDIPWRKELRAESLSKSGHALSLSALALLLVVDYGNLPTGLQSVLKNWQVAMVVVLLVFGVLRIQYNHAGRMSRRGRAYTPNLTKEKIINRLGLLCMMIALILLAASYRTAYEG